LHSALAVIWSATNGIAERTFSEYKASGFPTTRVGDFYKLPADLQSAGGSLDVTYLASIAAAEEAQEHGGVAGDYADGTPRFFSCQSCHMRPVESAGADKSNVEVRKDQPSHDHTGGNYWFADITKYQDGKGTLRFGGGLTTPQIEALEMGQQRAVEHLTQAASLEVSADTLKVINLTGHKLISGYPEGRRMWLNIRWFDSNDALLREDGAYGPLLDDEGGNVMVQNPAGGLYVQVESILDLHDSNTRIYAAHYAMTQGWADTLLAVGKPANLVLSYDRYTGDVDFTLGELAALPDVGEYHETFHFVLNNYIAKDNRIPPWGMSYDVAERRNVLPVPASQYGGGVPGSTYNYWDEIDLNTLKPSGAASAEIMLYYQGTSWEYIQFLNLANDGENAFLGQEGVNMLDAWINAEVPVAIEVAGDRKMVPPVVMAAARWDAVETDCSGIDVLIQSWIFKNSINCLASSSLTANTDVIVKSGVMVNFISPNTTLGPVFSVENGAEFKVSISE
jgi:hypothetical protein